MAFTFPEMMRRQPILFATAIEQSCDTEKSKSQGRRFRDTSTKALETDQVRWNCGRTAATTQGNGNGRRLPPEDGGVIAGTCPRPKNNCRLRAPRDVRNGDRVRWWNYIVLRGTNRSSPESRSRS